MKHGAHGAWVMRHGARGARAGQGAFRDLHAGCRGQCGACGAWGTGKRGIATAALHSRYLHAHGDRCVTAMRMGHGARMMGQRVHGWGVGHCCRRVQSRGEVGRRGWRQLVPAPHLVRQAFSSSAAAVLRSSARRAPAWHDAEVGPMHLVCMGESLPSSVAAAGSGQAPRSAPTSLVALSGGPLLLGHPHARTGAACTSCGRTSCEICSCRWVRPPPLLLGPPHPAA